MEASQAWRQALQLFNTRIQRSVRGIGVFGIAGSGPRRRGKPRERIKSSYRRRVESLLILEQLRAGDARQREPTCALTATKSRSAVTIALGG